jgi:thioredoxin 1
MWLRAKTVRTDVTEVILFTQETCGACATQREKNEGVDEAFPDVEFREVDIHEDLETAEEYGVRKTPTTLVYANGERTAEFVGVVERDELEAAIEDANRRRAGLAQRLVDFVRG